ncbi:YxiJ family protein [Bacillus sp. 7884-1]|uniref:YxiJ family protein n=1 Tax=Bacillus sp. 7884-1 TaxID=2021693 RepID=UPI000BA656C5|nr:YxiJ family protein [Bacillus sp. 7884-1]PAE38329.1 hypothetical protein CHI06_18680 [Bacillus sp. 7884-1]
MENIIKQLTEIKSKLDKSFPYRVCGQIQEDFRDEFLKLSQQDNSLNGDFNDFCMNIAGTLSYVLAGKTDRIPKWQIAILEMSFFDRFQQYKFLEYGISSYKEFFEEYTNFEETRKLLLQVLK